MKMSIVIVKGSIDSYVFIERFLELGDKFIFVKMINKEDELIIDKLCRCCMCENENMHNLFETVSKSHESTMVSLSEMLIACVSVEVCILLPKKVTHYSFHLIASR